MADPRWPLFENFIFIVMSYVTSPAYFADFKGNLLGQTICPPSFVVIAVIFLELRWGMQISPPPLPHRVPE